MYPYKTSPKANADMMVCGKTYRFTVLTPRLFRIEYNADGYFEDGATQKVINRVFSPTPFTVSETEDSLTIVTEAVTITYDKKPFCAEGLCVKLNDSDADVWTYSTENRNNLKGTARTVDRVDGPCPLEDGILSRNGEPVILDDSASLLIGENGEIIPRKESYTDQYLFCYGLPDGGNDHKGALKDFFALTGQTPLIPRFALGNWWSRYYAYTQDEYLDLMSRFKAEGIPFSVAVIDLEWHLCQIERKYGTGWSGYTWNEALFPDHVDFLKKLHDEDMKVSLNLHPDEGIAAHEKPYPQMAKAMGIDPETEETVQFDIANPVFLENYFKILHHPLEDEGVDFWWIDWQQGTKSSVPGLDPLWMLNHFHTVDNARCGKRPLIFSRYAGPGSHRYPLGFSGDSVMTWESLNFQPYFTATASNIGFGWWSHDIGGHMWGYRNSELYVRWVQLGVFSPINRLHSTRATLMNKEPWYYDRNTEFCLKKFLKLRHEMIPYIYTMNYRSHAEGEAMVQPLYYNFKGEGALKEVEYQHPNEYTFGSEMLIAPITSPADRETLRGCVETFFPEGMWYDFFTGQRYCGNKVLKVYRDGEHMPVFVKAGGIIPMAELNHINDVENPETLRIKVFAGADNTFDLYEDDGESFAYQKGCYATTKMELCWNMRPVFTIHRSQGDFSLPARNYIVELIGIEENMDILVTVDGVEAPHTKVWKNGVLTVSAEQVLGDFVIQFKSDVSLKANDVIKEVESFLRFAEYDNVLREKALCAVMENETADKCLEAIKSLELSQDIYGALYEIITAEEK